MHVVTRVAPPAREDLAAVRNWRHRARPALHDVVSSRVSCRKHPRVPTLLSKASTGQNPPPHILPCSSTVSIHSRACVVTGTDQSEHVLRP